MSQAATAPPPRSGRGSLSFARRILLPLALTVMLLATGVAAAAILTTRSTLTAQLDARAGAVRDLVDYRLHHAPTRAYLRALDRGISAAGRVPVQLIATPASRASVHSEGSQRTYTYPLGTLGGSRVSVLVRLSTSAVDADAWRAVLRALALAALLTLLIVVALHRLLLREITLPLGRLGEAIERIRGGGRMSTVEAGGPAPMRDLARGLERLAGAMAELDAQAATDPLTGVGNRRFFHTALATELKRGAREGVPVTLVLLDLDDFKLINDSNGHPFGDGILQRLATRLRACLRATDVLARVGGDEFAIVLPGLDSRGALDIIARARGEAGETFAGVALSWCAGVACYPDDARDSATLIECADVALYCAKSDGEPRDCLYEPDEGGAPRRTSDRVTIAALLELPDAIVPVFQPIVSLSTGEVLGYEALARFPHPPARRPDEWFELARACGLGPELEAHAAREALLPRVRPAGTYLAFNLSPSALASPEVAAVLPEDLTDIVLEITAGHGLVDYEPLVDQLASLRARGARIAIDDAGADYSGLRHVMRVAPDIIKLDRALVADVDSDPVKAALVDSYVRFASRTGAVVCAEGVETTEELRALTALDVGCAQGFGLGRPAPPWSPASAWVAAALRQSALERSRANALAVGGHATTNGDVAPPARV